MEHALRFARRRASDPEARSVDLLKAGATTAEVAAITGLSPARVEGIRGFYDHLLPEDRRCTGTACTFPGGGPPVGAAPWSFSDRHHTVRCLGRCYAAPTEERGGVCVRTNGSVPPAIPRSSLVEPPLVFAGVLGAAPPSFDLPDADAILACVAASGLRGRGGAAYPTAAKWRAAKETPAERRYVVVNGDEGDPGSFVDRLLLEEDPVTLLVGVAACARAIGADAAIVFIRAEYPEAQAAMSRAIDRHAAAFAPLRVQVVSGAGSYVCGEETALLRSIEGLRGEPWPRPPYPTTEGLWGAPTVVQNVETLVTVARSLAAACAGGRKAVSVSGAVARPGAVEVELGTPIRRILDEGAGGPAAGRTWRLALIGGPMGRVVPVERFDTPLSYDALPGMGHGGILVLDDRVDVRALALHLCDFARAESCGSCTPCRVGTGRLAEMPDAAALDRLLTTMEMGSLCGFGQGVGRPFRDLVELYGDEIFTGRSV